MVIRKYKTDKSATTVTSHKGFVIKLKDCDSYVILKSLRTIQIIDDTPFLIWEDYTISKEPDLEWFVGDDEGEIYFVKEY